MISNGINIGGWFLITNKLCLLWVILMVIIYSNAYRCNGKMIVRLYRQYCNVIVRTVMVSRNIQWPPQYMVTLLGITTVPGTVLFGSELDGTGYLVETILLSVIKY